MKYKAYILTYDRDGEWDWKAIHDNIINMDGIVNWFHYVKSSYILISTSANATDICNQLYNIIPQKRFLLLEVDLNNKNGWLPNAAWNWLRKYRDIIRNQQIV